MTAETMGRLARHRNIVGVKDATASLVRPLHTTQTCGKDFIQLSGEDHTTLAFLAAGGHGCISVTSNIAPRLCSAMHAAWAEGRIADAMAIQERLVPVHDAMFAEASPAPVKYAASLRPGRAHQPPADRPTLGRRARTRPHGAHRGGAAQLNWPPHPRRKRA